MVAQHAMNAAWAESGLPLAMCERLDRGETVIAARSWTPMKRIRAELVRVRTGAGCYQRAEVVGVLRFAWRWKLTTPHEPCELSGAERPAGIVADLYRQTLDETVTGPPRRDESPEAEQPAEKHRLRIDRVPLGSAPDERHDAQLPAPAPT